ncbi:hypothetical protein NHX12_003112 [Muraenolepis orangiensis]|uniref:Reverse transcriptase domain-containing protein n=3 Tax=Muraenolepis orangiensis TaxID=630683 RepID=A0A9Q0DYI1_9TELE|nr:hypothetical protein NHX12_003112 [Muraenolepis orangiensis]
MASSETPPPSLRQGVRIAPHDSSVSVEEALLAAGEQVGHGNLVFASRVNKAVLVFVKSEQMVHQLVASGVIIRDLYVQVSPLSVPSTRVTVSGVPPFIPNELLEVELRRFGKFASGFKTLLQKKRLELSSFLQERVKGALVRCRFLEIKEMDAPTPFFFNLERSVAQRKQMSCLKLPGGRVTSSPEEMRDHAMDFYTNLFGGEQCSIEGREEILEGLPQLSPEEKAALDLELTLEELTGAVNQMASGRAPGIDGLSGEFLKHFWGILGADLCGVFSECFRTGSLPLYSLAIEPLLCRLRSKLSGLSLPASCGLECPPTLSAYADDVSIFVSSQRDVQCLQDTLSLYERASSARVNWAKSSALLLGCWREQVVPSLPGGLQWETEGLKVLGVFLGTEAFKAKNWEGAKEKVCARLSKWKWLLPQMSYRGRVLVANTLVASTLWHRLMALTPPRNLVSSIQQEIVDFFWSGRHWVRAAALYLPLAEGGQGLICIQSKIASFRLLTVSRLLYDCGPSWLNFGKLLLRSVGRFGHKQLFLLNLEELDLSGLTPFYTSVLQAWHTFKFTRATSEMPGMWVFEEPLFFNGLLRARTLQSASLRTSLREAGCMKVGHLMKAKATSLEALRRRSNTSSIRILDLVVKEVTPAVGDWHEGAGQLLTLRTPHLGTFQACGKKETYNLCLKVLNLRSLAGVKESRWAEFLGPDSSPKGSWRCLYKLPVEKRTADLQWRIVHGAIATNSVLGCHPCLYSSRAGFRALGRSWFQGLGEELVSGPWGGAGFRALGRSWFQGLEEELVSGPWGGAGFRALGRSWFQGLGEELVSGPWGGAGFRALGRSWFQGLGEELVSGPWGGVGFRALGRSWFQGLGEEFSFILFIFCPKYSAKKKGAQCRVWGAGRYSSPVQGVGSVALQEPSAGCGERGATGAQCRVWGATGAQCRVWGAWRYRSPVQGVGSVALQEPSTGCGERGATGAQCRVWGAWRYRGPVQGVGSVALQEPSTGCGERGATGAQCRVWGAWRYRSPVQGVGSVALQGPSAGCGERGATGAQCRVWGAWRYRGPVQGVGSVALQEPSAGCGERGATGAQCRVWGAWRYRSPVQGVGSVALQGPSAGCGERGAAAGAAGASESQAEGGAHLLPPDGQHTGLQPHGGCGGGLCSVGGDGELRLHI